MGSTFYEAGSKKYESSDFATAQFMLAVPRAFLNVRLCVLRAAFIFNAEEFQCFHSSVSENKKHCRNMYRNDWVNRKL